MHCLLATTMPAKETQYHAPLMLKSRNKRMRPLFPTNMKKSKTPFVLPKEETKDSYNEGDYPLLAKIDIPSDLRRLHVKQLPQVCKEIQEYLIHTLSNVGGHFASNLGVIELTVALHYVYETPNDRLIWDVGHQIYPHKILTGRRNRLHSVRKKNGLSGFPKREESPYDLYNTGHAGTSISQLIGESIARDILKQNHKCVCVIGDASIASGMAFEALNHGGEVKSDCLVILNDNDMSISHNVGALQQYLNRMISSPLYNNWKRLWYNFLLWLPLVGGALRAFSNRIQRSFFDFFTPGGFFVNLGFNYVGPIDGHDVRGIVKVLRKLKKIKGPMLLHVYTQKGHGYSPAEKDPIQYHSVSIFNPKDGSFHATKENDSISYSQVVGETLLELAQKNPKVIAITPAMIEGSGLRPLYNAMPERVFDVGIAEQHSISFAGALASTGLIPYLCIYSTFLNRGLDQLIQDVGLMSFPVRIIIDRAGCVGPDGETHQGLYDLGMLLAIPHIHVYTPASGAELRALLYYMEGYNTAPLALRFPKSSCSRTKLEAGTAKHFDFSTHKPLVKGANKTDNLAIVCVGTMEEIGLEIQNILQNEERGKKNTFTSRVVSLRWIRPLDWKALSNTLSECKHFIIIEDSYIHSSAAAYILQNLPSQITVQHIHTFAFPEESIEHGSRSEIMEQYVLSPQSIINYLREHSLLC